MAVVDQLEPSEGEESRNDGPAPQPIRIRTGLAPPHSDTAAGPAEGTRQRSPGTERAEHVSEQHAHHRDAYPEDHIDEGGIEVGGERFDSLITGIDHEREQCDADEAAERHKPGRQTPQALELGLL